MYRKDCPKCGTTQTYKRKQHYQRALRGNVLCKSCSLKSHSPNKPRAPRVQLICAICGGDFSIRKCALRYGKQHFCSKECRIGSQTIQNTSECVYCKCEFQWYGKTRPRKFCSVLCANSWIFENVRRSKAEEKVAGILNELNIQYERQFRLDGKLYDFVVNGTTLLEVDGVYWHGKNKRSWELNEIQKINKINDKLKTKIAKFHGYTLKRIWEDEITEQNIRKVVG